MISIANISPKILLTCIACVGIALFSCANAMGQERLPHPIRVNAVVAQGLSFGAFTEGTSGGTITMTPTGTRTTTGDVVALGLGFTSTPALFEIEADKGTVIHILNGSNTTLTGSSGGTLTLQVGASSPTSPFITTALPPAKTSLTVGGTLTVGIPTANPPGNYSGIFYITVIKE